MKPTPEAKLELSEDEMRAYGYKIVDAIVEHQLNQNSKKPVATATRGEMDTIFQEKAPEKASDANEVLDFVMEKVIPYSNIMSHPKFFSFVPGPSNYVSAMADALATGFNIFSGGWAAAPAAAE
ncbi:MAG: decarboxylase, partial [Leeuwenhoekiella sp.]